MQSYDWKKPDWKPVNLNEDTEVGPDENEDGLEAEVSDDPEVPEGTPPLEEQPGYCSCQVFWIRGLPGDPDDYPPDLLECPFLGGQCEGVTYEVCVERNEIINFTGSPTLVETCHNVKGPVQGTDYQDPGVIDPNKWELYILHGGGPTLIDSKSNDAINGTRLEDIKITSVTGEPNDCGNAFPGCDLPEVPNTPGAENDPGQWIGVSSCRPPLSWDIEDVDSNSIIWVWDTTGSREDPLRIFGFEQGKYEYRVLCEEEGAPS